jgi:malonate transporter
MAFVIRRPAERGFSSCSAWDSVRLGGGLREGQEGSMEAVLNVCVPVFVIVLAGYVCGRMGVFGELAAEALNGFVYWLAFPALIFLSLSQVPVHRVLDWPLHAAYVGGVFGTFALAVCIGALAFGHRPSVLVIQGLAAAFANTAYMGVPLLNAAYGEDGALPAVLFTVFNASILLGIGVLLIELDIRSEAPLTKAVGGAARAVARNPLVLAGVAGLAVAASGGEVPAVVAGLFELLGAAAAPAALVAMGVFLVGKKPSVDVTQVSWLVFLKMLIHPALMDDQRVAATTISAGLPAGTLVFVLAVRYRLLADQVSAVILISTVLSALTLPALIVTFGVG